MRSNARTMMDAVILLFVVSSTCQGFSAAISTTGSRTVPILKPSEEESEVTFDVGCVANPVIIPPVNGDEGGEWQCYYYGNAGSWNKGHKFFLLTGATGLAVSNDGGQSWTKIVGSEEGGSILAPSEEGWDSVQTGVGDVVRIDEKELHMYYFGGSEEAIAMGPGSIVGFRMRIGRAKSKDNGRTWTKDKGYLLDVDESEGLFASWPRVVTSDTSPWKMFYHSFDGTKWRVYGAESVDRGDTWKRIGLVLEGGFSNDDFDFAGIGTRAVTLWRGSLLMIYEGVDESSIHRLGAALYDETKTQWKKLNDGLPILEPGKGPLGKWTKQVIGTPYVLSLPDGSLRLYHCGKDGPDGKMAIGVVASETGDIAPACWTPCS